MKKLCSRFPFWEQLREEEQNQIAEAVKINEYKKGMVVNRTDEGCSGTMLVLQGRLRAYMVSEEGREITLYRLHEKEVCVLSSSCLLDAIVFDVVIEAVCDTQVLVIPVAVMSQIMKQNPYVELWLSKKANERFSDVMWTMQQILFMGADKRLAIYLWDEITHTGQNIIPYTHAQIASHIGSAREVVTRILKYFSEEGVVKLQRGTIEVVNKEKLKSFV